MDCKDWGVVANVKERREDAKREGGGNNVKRWEAVMVHIGKARGALTESKGGKRSEYEHMAR